MPDTVMTFLEASKLITSAKYRIMSLFVFGDYSVG